MNTIHHMLEPNPSPAPRQPDSPITLQVPTAQAMHELGERLARSLHGGEVILLSGPLGAGKTTLAQGLGEGLGIQEPIVSPTFTIARELDGTLADGTPAHLIHVDAYRLGSNDYAPGQAQADLLLDELESLGLDEELEEPGTRTNILMEWGEQMAVALADERLEIRIQRPTDHVSAPIGRNEPTADGERIVTITPVGTRFALAEPADTQA